MGTNQEVRLGLFRLMTYRRRIVDLHVHLLSFLADVLDRVCGLFAVPTKLSVITLDSNDDGTTCTTCT